MELLLRVVLLLLAVVVQAAQHKLPEIDVKYTAFDDATWAVMERKVSNYERQLSYDQYMEGCREMAGPENAWWYCDSEDISRLEQNLKQPRSMHNYTKLGFQKVKAPAELMAILTKFWEANHNKSEIEMGTPSAYHNTWIAEPTMAFIEDESLEGGGYALRAQVADYVRGEIERWTGMKQAISSVYGIRTYHNGSILAPHVDRLPLVSSAILNVAQDVDEDWPLEVYDHNGRAYNVTMKPGDLVLYESHSIIHGRPFALRGRYYASIFIHFEPIGPLNTSDVFENIYDNMRYPPYIIPGESWDSEWRDENPNGWTLLEDAPRLVRDGDLPTIQYASSILPSIWNGTDDWMPIHEAVRHGHYDIVRFLTESLNVDLSKPCYQYQGTPYKLALFKLGPDHRVTRYLHSIRGNIEGTETVDIVIKEGTDYDFVNAGDSLEEEWTEDEDQTLNENEDDDKGIDEDYDEPDGEL
jgi:prolyl 4-hydroxylase